MTYRDQILMCPHCGGSLDKPRTGFERWPCKACQGIAIRRPQLERLLARFSDTNDLPFDLEPRASRAERACPACNAKMTPVTLLRVPVDRCTKDDLVWFDPDELETTIQTVIAEDDARKGWYRKLRELLFAN